MAEPSVDSFFPNINGLYYKFIDGIWLGDWYPKQSDQTWAKEYSLLEPAHPHAQAIPDVEDLYYKLR